MGCGGWGAEEAGCAWGRKAAGGLSRDYAPWPVYVCLSVGWWWVGGWGGCKLDVCKGERLWLSYSVQGFPTAVGQFVCVCDEGVGWMVGGRQGRHALAREVGSWTALSRDSLPLLVMVMEVGLVSWIMYMRKEGCSWTAASRGFSTPIC